MGFYRKRTRVRKPVAQIAKEHLIETGNDRIGYGDCDLLDAIAKKATHTTLFDKHPLDRHIAILNALDRSNLFEKSLFRIWVGNREGLARTFNLVEKK